MTITISQYVDGRILKLEEQRRVDMALGVNTYESSQRWARLNEMQKLKSKFTDKEGNWLI